MRHFTRTTQPNRRPSYSTIEVSRELFYNLDYPPDFNVLSQHQLDPKSRFYSRPRPRTLDLPTMLPYTIEDCNDRAKFLSHIVSHLYIAIKTLDIQGSLPVSAKDLANLKDAAGISDIDLALETSLFEMSNPVENEAVYLEDSQSSEDEDEDEENDGDSAMQHKKSPKSAAVVGVRTWTQELIVWLKMKYDMPVKLRISLARVYYAICLCRGQDINLKIYLKAFEILTRDTTFLVKNGMTLPWEQLYKEFTNHLPAVDSTCGSIEVKDHKQLIRLATRSSAFFPKEAIPKIYSKLGARITLSNASLVFSSMVMIPNRFTANGSEDKYDIRHYIASFFYLWNKLNKFPGFDEQVTSRIGIVAMEALYALNDTSTHQYLKLGKLGVFNEDQMENIFNTLMNGLSIYAEKYGSSKTKYFHGYASAIIYSIFPNSPIIKQIRNLFNAVESFVYPSNSGEWSRPISKLVSAFTYQFHKRYNLENEKFGALYDIPQEYKLDDQTVTEFVETILPIVKIGIQSKKNNAVDDYINALQLLAHLRPEYVLESVLVDIYESLEGVISTHRVTTALCSIEALARYFASTKIFRVHVVRLLLMALPGIDSNDLDKTIHTLDAFATISNFVPIYDISDENGDPTLAIQFTQDHLEFLQNKLYNSDETFDIDDELELSALKSATSAFKPLIKSLCERLFLLFENLPDPGEAGGTEKDIVDSLPKFLYTVIESMSDDIFDSFRDVFFDFVWYHTYHKISRVIGEICGSIIKRDPKKLLDYLEIFISKIQKEIEENGAGASRTGTDIVPRDQNLYWNVVILNECVGNAGPVIVECGPELEKLSFYLMEKVKGPTVFVCSCLVSQLLLAVSKIRLQENRLISPEYEKKYGVDEKCWGGFQFDEFRFDPMNTTFSWFIPQEKEVKFAVECFATHVSKTLNNISNLMKENDPDSHDANTTLKLADDFRLNLLYLCFSMSGVSYLLDPSYDEDIPKLNQHANQSIQQRLLLLKQIREAKDTASEKSDVHLENIQETLYKIVEDINKDSIPLEVGKFDVENAEEAAHLLEGGTKETSPGADVLKGTHVDAPFPHSHGYTHDLFDDSARATPAIDGVVVSTMNPAITFRERKLYTSRYFFGDEMEQRRSNELYLKLHRTRVLIGKSLHMICKYFVTNFRDNTKLFTHLLYVINIYFSDVGRERVFDSNHARINYTYIRRIQNVNRVRKAYTRMAIGARLEAYHKFRVALHATSRSQTPQDEVLIEDIVKLSVSMYADVADNAQDLMVDIMKRINGSYNTMIKATFKYLSKALDESNHKRIESGLSIFTLKRIKAKIQNDFYNIQKYTELLHRCIIFDNIEVQTLAKALFQSIGDSLVAPSSVCLIDHQIIDTIRPPDEYIDLEIRAVKNAKERKRKAYLERLTKLEDFVVANEKHNSIWWYSVLNLLLVTNIQVDLDIPTNGDIFQLLAVRGASDHPNITRLALKGITTLVNKLYQLQAIEYKLSNVSDLDYVTKGTKLIDTTPKNGESYISKWNDQLLNHANPDYYTDTKPNNGWLFWEDNMRGMTNEPLYKLDLTPADAETLHRLGNTITKEWFTNIVKLWVTDNESNLAFQGSDVTFVSTLVLLISGGYVKNFTFEDLLQIIEDIYIRDDKSCHMVVCELIAGILIGAKVTNPEYVDKRDEFIANFLDRIFTNDLTPDTRDIWNIFTWWTPAHSDPRRFQKVLDAMTTFTLNRDNDLAIRVAPRIGYVKSLAVSLSWCVPDPEKFLKLCRDNINYRYEAIRSQIGSLLAVLSFSFFNDSAADGETFVECCNKKSDQLVLYKTNDANPLLAMIPELFNYIESERLKVVDLPPHTILNSDYIYTATTVLTWLRQELKTSIAILFQDFADNFIVPFLLKLISMKEVCQLGNINPISVFKKVSQIPFTPRKLEDIIEMLESYHADDLNVVQSIIMGEFTETFFFTNLFKFNKDQRHRLIELVHKYIFHKNVEIRESASSTFSGLIHMSPPEEVECLISTYSGQFSKTIERIRRKYRKIGYKNIETDDSVQLHGATLGLGAIVHAFSFSSPPPKWVPQILASLATNSCGVPGITGKTAKDILGKFKKNRQDTWHIDSRVFSETQMQDLEGVLWRSYYI